MVTRVEVGDSPNEPDERYAEGVIGEVGSTRQLGTCHQVDWDVLLHWTQLEAE